MASLAMCLACFGCLSTVATVYRGFGGLDKGLGFRFLAVSGLRSGGLLTPLILNPKPKTWSSGQSVQISGQGLSLGLEVPRIHTPDQQIPLQ